MRNTDKSTALSRFLSLVLRHNPSAAFIQLDENGWVDVGELLTGCARAGKRLDLPTLERIVAEDSKTRYSFNSDRTKIRANQGHSVHIDLELKPTEPPSVLYHGTAMRFLDAIRAEGITKQSRQHVHLSDNLETAFSVGKRHGKPVVLVIDTAAMIGEGYKFFISENGVWLCEHIPWRFVSIYED